MAIYICTVIGFVSNAKIILKSSKLRDRLESYLQFYFYMKMFFWNGINIKKHLLKRRRSPRDNSRVFSRKTSIIPSFLWIFEPQIQVSKLVFNVLRLAWVATIFFTNLNSYKDLENLQFLHTWLIICHWTLQIIFPNHAKFNLRMCNKFLAKNKKL